MHNHDTYYRARDYAATLETAALEYQLETLQFLINRKAQDVAKWASRNWRPHYMDGDQIANDMARAAAYWDVLTIRKDAAKKAAGVMGIGACV